MVRGLLRSGSVRRVRLAMKSFVTDCRALTEPFTRLKVAARAPPKLLGSDIAVQPSAAHGRSHCESGCPMDGQAFFHSYLFEANNQHACDSHRRSLSPSKFMTSIRESRACRRERVSSGVRCRETQRKLKRSHREGPSVSFLAR